MPLIPKEVVTELPAAEMPCVYFASGAVKRNSTSRTRLTSDKVTFPIWKADEEGNDCSVLKKSQTYSRFRLISCSLKQIEANHIAVTIFATDLALCRGSFRIQFLNRLSDYRHRKVVICPL